jgi:MFS family permease
VLLVGQQLIGDFAGTIFEITMPSVRQALAPHHIIGRVTATISFIARAATLLGALVAGWMGGVVGLRPTMFAGAAGLIATALILGFSPIWSIADPADLVADSSTGVSDG